MSEKETLFIDDGYERQDTLDRVPGSRPAVTFKYRPALYQERLRYRDARTPADKAQAAVEIVRGHLVEWDAKGKDGQPVPITVANLRRLDPSVTDLMLDRILGYSAPRADGSGSDEDADLKN